MSSDLLIVHRHDDAPIVELRFNRPARKNALTLEMYVAATEALAAAAADDTRAVVLRGEGGVFTSGNDLGDFIQSPPSGPDSPVIQFLHAITTFEKPLLAAVEGHAVGIGTTMLLHCDLVYAAPSAIFQLQFINLALVPEAASSLILPRMMGHQRAAELLLLGDAFDAERAHELGIINAIVEADTLHEHTLQIARKLTRKAPEALRQSKRLMKGFDSALIAEAIQIEGAVFAERLQSPELMEAVSAFFEKRKPSF